MNRTQLESDNLNVVGLSLRDERYMFIYKDGQETAVMDYVNQFASNPDLSFTFYHAAIIITHVENTTNKRCKGK